MILEETPNIYFKNKGLNYYYFSGTGYLGASSHPFFKDQLIKSVKKWGGSFGSSRLANIKLSIYKKGEDYLANLLQKEAALTISSGTLSGKLAINALKKNNDAFFHLPKTHPVILTSNSAPVFIDNKLNPLFFEKSLKNIVICTDAIPALETQAFSFDFISKIPKNKNITLLLDESHSLGVLGTNGGGISTYNLFSKNIEVVVISSLGKAYGICGGVIAGSKKFIENIKNDNLYIGSAGMSPAFLDCFISCKKFYKNQLKALQKNLLYIASKLHDDIKINFSKDYPIIYYDDINIGDYLQKKKIVITNFYYVQSHNNKSKINKIIINANHTHKELDILINVINNLTA